LRSLRSCANADPNFKDITKFMNPQSALDFPAATTAPYAIAAKHLAFVWCALMQRPECATLRAMGGVIHD
jgi:hypothetical protein